LGTAALGKEETGEKPEQGNKWQILSADSGEEGLSGEVVVLAGLDFEKTTRDAKLRGGDVEWACAELSGIWGKQKTEVKGRKVNIRRPKRVPPIAEHRKN